jgi:drug/metabolite transporter (DMT)-like permease
MNRIYKKYFGELLLVASALFYSFEWLFIRNLFENVYTGTDITFAKAFFSVIILFVFFLVFRTRNISKIKLTKPQWLYVLLLGLASLFANIGLTNAIKHTSVANVLTIIYLAVFWTFIFGVFFLNEHFSYKKLIYTILAFLGILLVVSKDPTSLSLQFGVGEWLALLVSIFFACCIILNKHLSDLPVSFRVFMMFSLVTVVAFVSIVIQNGIPYLGKFLEKEYLLNGFYLAFTTGILGTGFKNWGTNYVPVSLVSIILLLEPIAQMTTAYFFADEIISLVNFVGIGLVFSMVILISRENKAKK